MLLGLQQNIGRCADLNLAQATPDVANSGYASWRVVQNQGSDKNHSRQLSATALLKSRLKLNHDLLVLQLRPLLKDPASTSTKKQSVNLDELYWEHQFSARSIGFLGQRKIANGVAMGKNPSDFLNQEKAKNQILDDADARTETTGDLMLGWSYFGQSYSVQSLLAAPAETNRHARALLQINKNFDTPAMDGALLVWYGVRPALGLNISAVVGSSTTLYLEAAWSKGRKRQTPLLSNNAMVVDVATDKKHWTTDVVVGGQYTTSNGVTLNAEYWRNNNGFSNQEYSGIVNTLTSGEGNIGLAANLLDTPGWRKNYTFFRVGDIALSNTLKGAITWIHNLDDSSYFLRGALNWDFSKTDRLRLGLDQFYGAPLSEYGSNKTGGIVFLVYTKYF